MRKYLWWATDYVDWWLHTRGHGIGWFCRFNHWIGGHGLRVNPSKR